jgi:signal transduction histidine kinase
MRRAIVSEPCRQVAEMLDASVFLSVPLHSQHRLRGRLFLVGSTKSLRPDDMAFVLQAVEQIMPMIDHIELVDRLASRASEDARRHVALDIHDHLIQPYIGIQLGVSSLQTYLSSLSASSLPGGLRERIASLEAMTTAAANDLRSYVGRLRSGVDSGDGLAEALERFVTRYSELTGITIRLDVPKNLHVPQRLGSEIFSIVSEGLSNIRRHSDALEGGVSVKKVRDHLRIMIQNDNRKILGPASFTPGSIAARTEALQGELTVEQDPQGCTCVTVNIPL